IGGAFMNKGVNGAFQFLEDIAANNYQWNTDRQPSRRVADGFFEKFKDAEGSDNYYVGPVQQTAKRISVRPHRHCPRRRASR
ncbi:hypothetical protein ACLOJK_004395, partial [Asimina triloba]